MTIATVLADRRPTHRPHWPRPNQEELCMDRIPGSHERIAEKSRQSRLLLAEMSIACAQMVGHSRGSRKRHHKT